MTQASVAPGTILDDRYEVLAHVGDGGMGNVFKARELGLERIVAVKVIHPSLLGDDEMLNRFKREGIVLSQLNHPNLLLCYRFGISKDLTPYIAMEFLEGRSLSSILTSSTLDPKRLLRLARQICAGMEHAHKANVIHRDIKPANIMILQQNTENERVKILDFGLAGLVTDHNDGSRQHLTQTGALIGSVYYMSPEQCMGRKTDGRSDIYSVGCVLYECLTGAPPLVADTPVGLMHLHTKEYPAVLSKAMPDITMPDGLNDVIMRAMAKDPDARYQTMAELDEALALVAAGKGKSIPAFHIEETKTKGPAKQHAIPQILLAVLTLCLIAVTSLVTLSASKHQPSTTWIGHSKPKTNPSELVSHKLIKATGPTEMKLNPAEVEAWLEKFGHTDTLDKIHAQCLLYRANAITLNKALSRIEPDIDEVISQKLPTDFDTQFAMYRACKDYVYLLQLKFGRPKGAEIGFAKFNQALSPHFQRRLLEEMFDTLRNAGLFEEQLALYKQFGLHSGRDELARACCLLHLGRLTKADRNKAITAFKKMASAEKMWEDLFLSYRSLVELDACEDALEYSKQHLRTGQFEENYRAICLNQLGRFTEAEDLLENPTLGDHRLPLRAWNALSLDKQTYQSIKKDLALDFLERTHDPRSLARTAYHLADKEPEIVNLAMQNALSQLNSEDYSHGFLSISYVAAALNHLGKPEQAQAFIDSRLSKRPANFRCVWHEEIIIALEYAIALRLQKHPSLAKERLTGLLKVARHWPSAARFTEGIILAELARANLDLGDLAAADDYFEKAFEAMKDKVEVSVVDKIIVLEEHARLCADMGNVRKSKELTASSHKMLHPSCRNSWVTWMPFSPDYQGLRVIAPDSSTAIRR